MRRIAFRGPVTNRSDSHPSNTSEGREFPALPLVLMPSRRRSVQSDLHGDTTTITKNPDPHALEMSLHSDPHVSGDDLEASSDVRGTTSSYDRTRGERQFTVRAVIVGLLVGTVVRILEPMTGLWR